VSINPPRVSGRLDQLVHYKPKPSGLRGPPSNMPKTVRYQVGLRQVHRFASLIDQSTLSLNTSVLNKMPRDCTAQTNGYGGWTVPFRLTVSLETILNPFF